MTERLAAVQTAQEQAQARQTGGPDTKPTWKPPPIATIDDTGLNIITLADLAIKTLYFSGFKSGYQMAESMKLPFTGVIDHVMELLKRDKWVEVKGTGGFGEGAYQYVITELGTNKAREVLERSQYAGPAPPLFAKTMGGADLGVDHFAVDRVLRKQGDQEVTRLELGLDTLGPVRTNLHGLVDKYVAVLSQRRMQFKGQRLIRLNISLVGDEQARQSAGWLSK